MRRRNAAPSARPAQLALVGLAALLALGACGLEDRSGAIRPVESASAAAPAPDTDADDRVRPGVASIDPNWQEVQLGPHVSAWVPLVEGWQVSAQGTNLRGGSYLAMGHPGAQLSVRVETWPNGDQSAAALCASTLAALLDDAGVTDTTPQPSGNPAGGSQLLDAFRCTATGVTTRSGSIDYRLTVVVRETDQITYTQLITLPSEPADPAATNAALELTDQMLARTLGRLEQR